MKHNNNGTIKLVINDSRRIGNIQEEFNARFPYLKIEFFSRSHKIGAPSSKKLMKHRDQTIGECRTTHKKGQISISASMTAAELEQLFREVYGLNVQLFRKSGKIWLETTVTDGWTLEQQNNQGEALSNLVYTNSPRTYLTGDGK